MRIELNDTYRPDPLVDESALTERRPRRSGAPVPLLVPCFLARTRPLLCPRRSMRRSTSEPTARVERVGL